MKRHLEPAMEYAAIILVVLGVAGVGVLGAIVWERYHAMQAREMTDEERAAQAILGALVCQGVPANVREGGGGSCGR